MKNSLTQVNDNPDDPELYTLNTQTFMSSIQKLLKYIVNKEDYNFFNIHRRYNTNNIANNFFVCYNFNSIHNLFEKIINFILSWSCILIHTNDMNHNIFNNIVNERINTSTRVILIKNIYEGNGIFIDFMKAGINAFFFRMLQYFLSYMWNLGSKLELLKPLIV